MRKLILKPASSDNENPQGFSVHVFSLYEISPTVEILSPERVLFPATYPGVRPAENSILSNKFTKKFENPLLKTSSPLLAADSNADAVAELTLLSTDLERVLNVNASGTPKQLLISATDGEYWKPALKPIPL